MSDTHDRHPTYGGRAPGRLTLSWALDAQPLSPIHGARATTTDCPACPASTSSVASTRLPVPATWPTSLNGEPFSFLHTIHLSSSPRCLIVPITCFFFFSLVLPFHFIYFNYLFNLDFQLFCLICEFPQVSHSPQASPSTTASRTSPLSRQIPFPRKCLQKTTS